MAQWLRGLVLAEGLGLGPSSHMVAHLYLYLQFQGIQHSPTDMDAENKNTNAHKKGII